jgi:hypothetical protein
LPKYYYKVLPDVMEDVYLENAKTDFFKDEESKQKFNAELCVIADNEEDSLKIRVGVSDIRMWELDRIEE